MKRISHFSIYAYVIHVMVNHNQEVIIMSEQNKPKKPGTYTPAPMPHFSSENRYYLTYTQALESITGSPWGQCSGSTLADVRKKVGQDLVEDPGMPEMVILPSEYEAAQLRAEMMKEKIEDIVVTMVLKIRYSNPPGTIRVESLRYSQLAGRIAELKQLAEKENGHVFVVSAYSEESKQEYWWNDLELETKPRLPKYGDKPDRKRTAYRNSASGV